MGKQYWVLSVGNKGQRVLLYDLGPKNRFRKLCEAAFMGFDARITRYWLGGSGMPEFMWNIPVGKPKYELSLLKGEEGEKYIVNSVPAKLFDIMNYISYWVYKDLDDDLVEKVNISPEAAIRIAPDLNFLIEDNVKTLKQSFFDEFNIDNNDNELSPQRAKSLIDTKRIWQKIDEEFGLLTKDELREVLGYSVTVNSNSIETQRIRGNFLGIEVKGEYLYPGFQFDNGRVIPAMPEMIAEATKQNCQMSDIVLWMCSPTTSLPMDARPVDLILTEPELVVQSAADFLNDSW